MILQVGKLEARKLGEPSSAKGQMRSEQSGFDSEQPHKLCDTRIIMKNVTNIWIKVTFSICSVCPEMTFVWSQGPENEWTFKGFLKQPPLEILSDRAAMQISAAGVLYGPAQWNGHVLSKSSRHFRSM